MATDNSIQNQKVFVKLAAVLQLQDEYRRAKAGERQARDERSQACWTGRREAFESVIITLELPIQLQLGGNDGN